MKLSISNIGWTAGQDDSAYRLMKTHGFTGLEIAPTRIFADAPYERRKEASVWAGELKRKYGFCIPSMQSIWYGRKEKIFGTEEERKGLIEYTKRAIDFAVAIGCGNLVFGCPVNRNLPDGVNPDIGVAFYREIGEYAAYRGTVIGMEANPPIYHTNYINDTATAFELIRKVDSEGFKLNLDIGTMLQNKENIEELRGMVYLIHHVHISEPGLKPVEERAMHALVRDMLIREGYQGYVSIEMGRVKDMKVLEEKMIYMRRVFYE